MTGKNFTEEEIELEIMREIEYDAEGGYFDDAQTVDFTREFVHSFGELPPCLDYVEGLFPDNTEYVSELWIDDEYPDYTFVTYYYEATSKAIFEDLIEEYLIKMGKLKSNEQHSMSVMLLDVYGHDIYSVTVAVTDGDEILCTANL